MFRYKSSDCKEKELLVIIDSTFPNFERNKGKLKLDSPHIGYLNKNDGIGFMFTASLVVSPTSGLPLGMGACRFHVRPFGEENVPYKQRPPQERESTQWFECIERTRQAIDSDVHLTAVCDREADLYDFINQIARLPNTSALVRVARDRIIVHQGRKQHLWSFVQSLSVQARYAIRLREQAGRPARVAHMALSWARIELARPQAKSDAEHLDKQQAVNVIWAHETGRADGLSWLLYTTLPIESAEDALKAVEKYKHRWLIEDTFRIAKSDGLDLEASQIESGAALQRLTLVCYAAAIQILGMRQGREHQEPGSIKIYFTPLQQSILRLLWPHVQGKRGKQLNPYPPDTLAWGVWIIARLGGWKPGNSERPPGVIALLRGWLQFRQRVAGAELVLKRLEGRVPQLDML